MQLTQQTQGVRVREQLPSSEETLEVTNSGYKNKKITFWVEGSLKEMII